MGAPPATISERAPTFYRIFPYLGELTQKIFKLDEKRHVIDVGADVGDALAAMFSHKDSFSFVWNQR